MAQNLKTLVAPRTGDAETRYIVEGKILASLLFIILFEIDYLIMTMPPLSNESEGTTGERFPGQVLSPGT